MRRPLLACALTALVTACAHAPGRNVQMKVIQVENHSLEYVAINMTLLVGSALDPPGKEGLAFFTSQMLTRGTKKYTKQALAEEIDFLGSNISVSSGNETVQVVADCASRNLPRLLELVTEVVVHPTFPEAEVEKLKRQTLADIAELKDSDGAAAALFFGQLVFEGHPYAHPTRGFARAVETFTRDDVVRFYREHYVRSNAVIGVAGDVTGKQVDELVVAALAGLPAGSKRAPTPPVLSRDRGLDILLVTKPERTQSHVLIGHPSVRGDYPDLFPLSTAITGFGGTFTSILVREIREKRGWSYGVGASVLPGRYSGVFQVRFAPATGDTVPAVELTLKMLGTLAQDGLDEENLDFARQYLINQYPFLLDSSVKKMELELNAHLTGKPADYLDSYVETVEAVTGESAGRALKESLTPGNSSIVIVGDEGLEQELKALPGVARVRTVPHSWDGPLPQAPLPGAQGSR